jgi:4-aminobutyrate aminotransferase
MSVPPLQRTHIDGAVSPLADRRRAIGVMESLGRTAKVLELEELHLADLMKIRFYPFALRRGRGCWVEDEDGNLFLDLCAGAGVMNIGYGNKRVIEAVHVAMEGPWSTTSAVFAHEAQALLAERLNALIPGDTKVWFGTSGSEALDMLARYARLASGRSRLVSFVGADHGQTSGSAQISGLSFHGDARTDDVTLLPYPDPYRCPHGPCDVGGCSLDCLRPVEAALDARPAPAAVFFEPLQANGGDVVPPANVLPALREACDAAGSWLIVDEIKVGLGRTGTFFAHESAGVVPDAVALGKALAGGLPLAAVIGRREIVDAAVGGCVTTLAGSPIPCAAALATLDVLIDDRLLDNARQQGDKLLQDLRAAASGMSIVGDIRGQGLILGIELVEDRALRVPSRRHAAATVYRTYELGALTIYTGVNGNVVELTPPLTLSSDEVDVGVTTIVHALADVEAGTVPEAALAAYSGW